MPTLMSTPVCAPLRPGEGVRLTRNCQTNPFFGDAFSVVSANHHIGEALVQTLRQRTLVRCATKDLERIPCFKFMPAPFLRTGRRNPMAKPASFLRNGMRNPMAAPSPQPSTLPQNLLCIPCSRVMPGAQRPVQFLHHPMATASHQPPTAQQDGPYATVQLDKKPLKKATVLVNRKLPEVAVEDIGPGNDGTPGTAHAVLARKKGWKHRHCVGGAYKEDRHDGPNGPYIDGIAATSGTVNATPGLVVRWATPFLGKDLANRVFDFVERQGLDCLLWLCRQIVAQTIGPCVRVAASMLEQFGLRAQSAEFIRFAEYVIAQEDDPKSPQHKIADFIPEELRVIKQLVLEGGGTKRYVVSSERSRKHLSRFLSEIA